MVQYKYRQVPDSILKKNILYPSIASYMKN